MEKGKVYKVVLRSGYTTLVLPLEQGLDPRAYVEGLLESGNSVKVYLDEIALQEEMKQAPKGPNTPEPKGPFKPKVWGSGEYVTCGVILRRDMEGK